MDVVAPATAPPAAQAQALHRSMPKLPLGLLQLVTVTLEDVTLQVDVSLCKV